MLCSVLALPLWPARHPSQTGLFWSVQGEFELCSSLPVFPQAVSATLSEDGIAQPASPAVLQSHLHNPCRFHASSHDLRASAFAPASSLHYIACRIIAENPHLAQRPPPPAVIRPMHFLCRHHCRPKLCVHLLCFSLHNALQYPPSYHGQCDTPRVPGPPTLPQPPTVPMPQAQTTKAPCSSTPFPMPQAMHPDSQSPLLCSSLPQSPCTAALISPMSPAGPLQM